MNTEKAYYEAFLELGSFAAVARRFGVSRGYVHKILRGSSYDIPALKSKSASGYANVSLRISKHLYDQLERINRETKIPLVHQIETAIEYYIEEELHKRSTNGNDRASVATDIQQQSAHDYEESP